MRYSVTRWTLICVLCCCALLLALGLTAAVGASATASAAKGALQGSRAPLSPAFVQYQQDLAVGRVSNTTSSGRSLGHIPAPQDYSYTRGMQVLAGGRRATVPPASYDLRALGRLTPVKDQGEFGTCWAFAAMGALESCLLPGTVYDFSEDNMVLKSGFDAGSTAAEKYNSGGIMQWATAYLVRWGGPMLESQDPYGDGVTPAGLTPSKHVQNVYWIPERGSATDNANIKNAVMTYGGVHASIFWDDAAYKASTASYYYTGSGVTNHDVVIVGWNDNYAAGNFGTAPPGNGAFLVRNSWGPGWGQGGYFWTSYYDTKFARQDLSAVYPRAEAPSNYTRVYQYDPLGDVYTYGFGTSTAWFANVFTASATESLSAVGFYAEAPGATYQVYTGTGTTLTSRTLRASGTLAYMGYNTVTLPTPATVTAGQKFFVEVKVTTPGTSSPISVEDVGSSSGTATAAAGQSYVSSAGTSWTDLTTQSGCEKANVCLKDYTKAALVKTRYEETNALLTFSPAWTAVTNAGCSGGSMRTHAAAGSLTAAFTGPAVSVVATKGPAYGKMKVTLDGNAATATTVDLNAPATAYKQTVLTKSGLTSAAHTIKVEWLSGTVNLDALDVTGTLTQAPLPTVRYQESDAKLLYSSAWTNVANASCSGGYMRTRNAAGAVTALFKGTGVSVIATKGSAYGKLKVTCDGVATTVDLYAAATAYQQKVYTKTGLANAAHTLKVEWLFGTVNLDALDVQGALTDLATTTYQETDAKLAYSPAWTAVSDPSCSGGAMRTRIAAGLASAAFTGTGVSVVATKGPAYGKLKVTLDGVATTVDLYAAAKAYQQRVYVKAGLGYAAHTLRLEWTNSKNLAASATTVNLDALQVTGALTQAPAIYQESDAKLLYSPAWTAVSNLGCSAGAMRTRATAGSVTAAFTGTAVNVIATKGPAYGKMKVTLDGNAATATTVDLYAAANAYQQKVYAKSGLTNAAHTLKLEWTNSKNLAATATTVDLDALEVTGTLTQATANQLVGSWSDIGDNYEDNYIFRADATYTRALLFADETSALGLMTDDGKYAVSGGSIQFSDTLETWAPDPDDPSGYEAYTDEPIDDFHYAYRFEDAGATLVITEDDGSEYYYNKD